jgi:hypothetical protein
MEQVKVPEKIILSADRETGKLYDEWVIKDLTDNIKIEYTRTDVFIEKAKKWLEDELENYISCDGEWNVDWSILGDFKKAMEGE